MYVMYNLQHSLINQVDGRLKKKGKRKKQPRFSPVTQTLLSRCCHLTFQMGELLDFQSSTPGQLVKGSSEERERRES